jgi:RimJ/RimL family protein N-acetyltransferase
VKSFWACLDSVARERSGLAITEAFPLRLMEEFVAHNLADGIPAFFALEGDRVIGWADLRREPRPAHRHRAVLGMGVHQDYRNRGVGRQLLETLIAAARQVPDLVRIDLTVYAGNDPAVKLYRRCGFQEEGRLKKGRYLDGQFDDILQMGLLLGEKD